MKTTPFLLMCALLLGACRTAPKDGVNDEMTGEAIVLEVLGKGLARADMDVIHTYVAEDYKQHNPMAADGRAGLVEFIKGRSPDERQELRVVRIFEDGEFVFAHSEFVVDDAKGKRIATYAIMDVWRVRNGQLVEHWDAMQEQPATTASGRSMVDGPDEVKDQDATEANRKFVREFVTAVLVEGKLEEIPRYISGDNYAQHNPNAPDGPKALRDFLQGIRDSGVTFTYEIKRVFADGDFVLVQAKGGMDGAALAIYDLFRCENGKVAEHWDVIQTIPAESKNDNGMVD
jgi:predicted SnoaL-like aldol condensation-catalyzing enzyme